MCAPAPKPQNPKTPKPRECLLKKTENKKNCLSRYCINRMRNYMIMYYIFVRVADTCMYKCHTTFLYYQDAISAK